MRDYLRSLMVFLLLMAGGASAEGDVVLLKSQRKITGVITEQNKSFIKMDIGSGMPVTYYWDQIENIQATPLEKAFDTSAPIEEPKEFLWEIKAPQATVYLFGTVHLGRQDMYPLPKPVEDAFNRSDVLVLEINADRFPPDVLQRKILEKALCPAGNRLVDLLPSETVQKLQEYLMARGILIDQFMGYKPWFVAMVLTKMQISALGFSEHWGVDKYLAGLAAKQQKQIMELEGIEEQLGFLDSLPNQAKFLEYSLISLAETESMLQDILSSWANGDASRLEELLITKMLKEAPDLEPIIDVFLTERNAAMVEKIKGYLNSQGTYFVAVGAAHLVGDKGIVTLLAETGYPGQQQ